MASLGAPKAVSPFIKACRWGLLVAGIAYGSMRYNYLAKREVGIKEYEDGVRARIAARQAAEKEVAAKVELDALGKECGVSQ